ncbi:Uncharacterized membrane protein [Collimonas sp. OK307]|nr:Uncharacterized membrane protein [Collimonas sp. OK307]
MRLRSKPDADQPSSVRQKRCKDDCQHGSIVIMAAICLSIMVILLSSIDIGYLFYMKRDLQKVADLAALAGAQQLVTMGNPTTCVPLVVQAAIGNAQANGFSNAPPNAMANAINPICGVWNPAANPAPDYFSVPAPAAGTSLNAVKVIVSQTVPVFFGLGGRALSAEAIASGSSPIAAFSIGTGLLSLCTANGSLTALLVNGLLGSNICLSLASYNGLLGAQVSLLQVLTNMGLTVGSIDQVINAKVSLGQLVSASIQALSATSPTNLDIAAINKDLVKLTSGPLSAIQFKIGDILKLNPADGVAALSTQINVLDLLNIGTLQLANGNNLINLGANVDLGPLGQVGLQLRVIEPPQMAVGSPKSAVAKSAQVRLALNVNALLGLVNLPLFIDVAPGIAQLDSVQCSAPQSAKFNVTTGVAQVCLAKGQNAMSQPGSCPDITDPTNQVTVFPLVTLGINTLPTTQSQTVPLYPPPLPGVSPSGPSSQTVGSSLSTTLGGIITSKSFSFGGILSLLNPLLMTLGAVLNPVLAAVGGVLDTLFSALGIGVGQSTLNLSSITCGNVKLVY